MVFRLNASGLFVALDVIGGGGRTDNVVRVVDAGNTSRCGVGNTSRLADDGNKSRFVGDGSASSRFNVAAVTEARLRGFRTKLQEEDDDPILLGRLKGPEADATDESDMVLSGMSDLCFIDEEASRLR